MSIDRSRRGKRAARFVSGTQQRAARGKLISAIEPLEPRQLLSGAPVATDGTFSVVHDQTLTIYPNELEGLGSSTGLTPVIDSTPTTGTWTTLSGGSGWTYTPVAGWTGSVAFSYSLTDGTTTSQPATIDVTDAVPQLYSGSSATDSYSPVSGSVLGLDADSDPLTYSLVSAPTGRGAFTLNSDGTFSYDPQGFRGYFRFTFKATDGVSSDSGPIYSNTASYTIDVTADNTPGLFDPAYSCTSGGSVSGYLNGVSDSDFASTDCDPSGFSLVPDSGPSLGNVTVNSDGTFTYTSTRSPSATTAAVDTFKFQNTATDQTGTVTIDYSGYEGAPPVQVPLASAPGHNFPWGGGQTLRLQLLPGTTFTTSFGTLSDALMSDSNDGMFANGQVSILHAPSTDPAGGGTPEGTFTLNDATQGTYTYVAPVHFRGWVYFTYDVTDTDASSPDDGQVSAPVTGAFDILDSLPDEAYYSDADNKVSTPVGQRLNLDPRTPYVDDNQPLSVLTTDMVPGLGPQHGTVITNPDGTISYQPNEGYIGPDSFTYQIGDGTTLDSFALHSQTDTLDANYATIFVTVTPPVAQAPATCSCSLNGAVNPMGQTNVSLPSLSVGALSTAGTVGNTQYAAAVGGIAGPGSVVGSQPSLVQGTGSYVGVIDNAGSGRWFSPSISNAAAFSPMFAGLDSLSIVNAPASDGGSTSSDSGYNQEYELIDGSNGSRSYFHTFDPLLPADLRGKFIRSVDQGGDTVAATYYGGSGADAGEIESLTSTTTTAGVTGTQALDYDYLSSGLLSQVVSTIAASNVDGGAPVTVQTEDFSYYSVGAINGAPGQLETAAVKDAAGNVIDSTYLRYASITDPNGDGGAVKNSFGSDAYARLLAAFPGTDPDTLTDAQVQGFADTYLSYNFSGQVATETTSGTGCSTCAGGLGTANYTYASSGAGGSDSNTWQNEVDETLPNGTQDITFSSFSGQTILSDVVTSAGLHSPTFTQYSSSGNAVLTAQPSAFVPDGSGNYYSLSNANLVGATYLSASAGLIQTTDYYGSTTATSTTPGAAAGYEQDTKVQQGTGGTPILQESMAYYAFSDSGGSTGVISTIYPLATDTTYANTDGTGARTVSYNYVPFTGTVEMSSESTTLPTIDSGQNGSGAASTNTEILNSNGQVVFSRDAQGFITYQAWDAATGALVKSIQDLNTANTSDYDPTLLPAGWSTPAGGGLNLVTTYQVDSRGRTVLQTDPNGDQTVTVFKDGLDTSTGFVNEQRVYPGWHQDPTTGLWTTTGPVQVTRQNRVYSYTETLTYAYTPVSGVTMPDGSDAIDSGNIQSLSRDILSDAGQILASDAYSDLTSVTYSPSTVRLGVAGTNYNEATYAYDANGNQCRVRDQDGTITRTVFDGDNRPASTWVGTNDSPATGYWSPSNPAGMTMVSQNVYDNGGVGDGNLTQTTLFPGGSQAPRITQSYFDWRDRAVASKTGIIQNTDGSENLSAESDGTNRPIEFSVYDNLGEVTAQETFTGDGVAVTTAGGVVNAPSASLLRAKSTETYDDQGNVYQASTFSVDPSSGAVGDAITTNTFRDLRGDAIATYTGGSGAMKAAFDGAGRQIMSYTTDGGAVNNGGTPLMDDAHAGSVTSDVVVSQNQNVLDGDGNPIETVESDRLPGDSVTAEGALGNASGTGGPAARVSYDATFYNEAQQETANENVGTNGGTAWTRPTTPDANDATHLVTSTTYGGNGLEATTTDPRGIVNKTFYNLLGETTETIDAYSGDGTPTNDTNQTTTLTYNGEGNETSQTAVMPAGTPSQTTDWIYGVSTMTGSTINSYDLLAKIVYPDPSTTDGTTGEAIDTPTSDVTYTDDNLGEALTMTDQNGTIHGFVRDLLGRGVSDSVTVLGSGVDGSVLQHAISYNQQGGVYKLTAYADAGGLTLVNQVQDAYNGLQQLTGQYEAVSGAVNTSTTPQTQYAYSDPTSGSIMTATTYPNGRVLDYSTSGNALDAALGRVDSIADNSAPTLPLASYTYMGLSTIVQQLDGNNIGLSYIHQAGDSSAITSGPQSAGDPVTGLGQFGQVIDQNWVLNPTPASTPTPTPTPAPLSTDRTQLAYDRAGNVLYSNNLVSPTESQLYHSNSTASGDDNNAYDPLQRLTNFERGTLSASGNNASTGPGLDTVSSPSKTQSFALDAVGNQSSVTTNGTPVDNTTNAKNELTANGSATLGYDPNGNTLVDQAGNNYSYDAWNQIATNINLTTHHQTTYTSDALGDRVTEQDGAGTASGPVLIVNSGSVQRSMVDSLTVVFPSTVTLSTGAITLENTTTSTSEPVSWSNPSGDGKTWLVAFTGTDIVGGSLPDGVYNLVIHHADVSGITLGSDVVYAFHRLFGDINGDGTVNAVDNAEFNLAVAGQYDPAFDYNADSTINGSDSLQLKRRLNAGTTYTYTPQGAFLVGPSTTAPVSSTDISSWSAPGTNDLYYSGSNVIEERQSGTSGAWRQELWGFGYVNSLIEQDTATAVDSGGVLPTSHFLQYALDTSFNGTGVNVTSTSGSYDSVAIQGNGQIVAAGVTGSNLTITRYNPNAALDPGFGTAGVVTIAETSPSFCKLAIDSGGNIDVAVNSGSTVKLYQLSGADGSTNWSTTLTFATSVVPQGLAIDPSGKIVVAGDSSSGTGIYVARVTSSGSVDTTFGSSGYVNAPLSGAPSALSLAFDYSGNILIAGSDGGDFSVVRLTPSGSLDTTFNSTGEAKIDMGGTDTAFAVAPGPGGTIAAAGVSVQGGSNYNALIRLTSAGALDTTFNSTGKALGSSGSGTIRAILVQTNGEILAGGDASSGTAQKVWMFTPAGAADTAFATGGTLTANSGATVFGWAVASGATQRIVVAGSYGGYAALAAFAPASLRLYAQQDANYDVTAMVDANGNVVQRYLYDSYGNMTVLSATWTPQSDLFNTQVGFQGMWLDAASGLYHTPGRDYSVELGRWVEQDPDLYVNGPNTYQAFGGNPASVTDPLGTKFSDHNVYNVGGVRAVVALDGYDGKLSDVDERRKNYAIAMGDEPFVNVCIGFDWSALHLDDCDDVEIVQLVRKTDDSSRTFRYNDTTGFGNFESVRATSAIAGYGRDGGDAQRGGFIIDRRHGQDSPFYGVGNDGKVLNLAPGVPELHYGTDQIWMVDQPSVLSLASNLGVSFAFETYAVVVDGPDTGKVLAGVGWGFDFRVPSASDPSVGPVTDPYSYPLLATPTYWAAKDLWDAQASSGTGAPKNSPNQIKFGY